MGEKQEKIKVYLKKNKVKIKDDNNNKVK